MVLKAKEGRSLRPHGHIIRTGDRLVPDEASLTSTTWRDGVFHSFITQGHVNINRFLSTARSYLGLLRSGGLRIFVQLEDGYHLLGVPSAFEMTPGTCRWIGKLAECLIQITSRAATNRHELTLSLEVLAGPSADSCCRITSRLRETTVPNRCPFACSDVRHRRSHRTRYRARQTFPEGFFRIDARPGTAIERVAGDEALFADGRSRHRPFLVIITRPIAAMGFRITGGLISGRGGRLRSRVI